MHAPWQKDHADAILARGRQGDTLGCHFFPVQSIGQLDQDTGAVAHQFVGTHRTPMVEVFKNLQRILDDGVAFLTTDMGDKTHAARVVLIGIGIETVFLKMLDFGSRGHGALLKMTVDDKNTA